MVRRYTLKNGGRLEIGDELTVTVRQTDSTGSHALEVVDRAGLVTGTWPISGRSELQLRDDLKLGGIRQNGRSVELRVLEIPRYRVTARRS